MRVNIGVAYWLLVNLSGMATAAYQTFLQWGLAAGGSQASGLLLTPSTVVDLGFQIAAPLQDCGDRHDGDWAVLNMPQIAAGPRRDGHCDGVPLRRRGPDGDAN